MNVPKLTLYADALPEAECLALFPGAVTGTAADPVKALFPEAGLRLDTNAPVREISLPSLPVRHLLAGAAVPLKKEEPESTELFKRRLQETFALADSLGVKELCLLPLPADAYDSRLFACNAVLFRELMQDREHHPCLENIRFLCRNRADAEWLAKVYNFYYPESKADRMLLPEE